MSNKEQVFTDSGGDYLSIDGGDDRVIYIYSSPEGINLTPKEARGVAQYLLDLADSIDPDVPRKDVVIVGR